MAPSHAISWPLGGSLLAHIQFPEILMRGSVAGIAVGKARVRELQWRTAAVLLTPLFVAPCPLAFRANHLVPTSALQR